MSDGKENKCLTSQQGLRSPCFDINPYLANGLSHHYHLGESTFIFRGFSYDFKFLSNFFMNFL